MVNKYKFYVTILLKFVYQNKSKIKIIKNNKIKAEKYY